MADDRKHEGGREFHEYAGTATMAAGTSFNTSGVLLVIDGIWLIIASFLLGYSSVGQAMWNDIIFGIIIGVLALINFGAKMQWISWLTLLIGIWLIIAPFALVYGNVTGAWNDVILGIITIILAGWQLSDRVLQT